MMKSFFFKFILIAISLIAIDFVAGIVFSYIQQLSFEKEPLRFEVRAMYAIEKSTSEIDIIGSSDASHSYISNQISDSLGMTVYNYAKDGCFFVYQNCLISLMLEHHTPKMIIWEIGKDCLAASINNDSEWQSFKDFYPYYFQSEYCNYIINSRGLKQRILMFSGLYRFNNSFFSIVEPFITNNTINNNLNGYLPLPNDGYEYPAFDNNPKIEEEIDNNKIVLLENTLEKCYSKGIKMFFCFSPKYYKDYADDSDSFKKLIQIADRYDIRIIDFRNNALFMSDSSLFKDINHLNDRGAHEYMKLFIPCLKGEVYGQ